MSIESTSDLPTESIRVLHIFAPNFRNRFGGPIFDWKFAFSAWNDPAMQHLVLDSENRKVLTAIDAFDFEISSDQYILPKKGRFRWIFTLLQLLRRHRSDYDIIHVHILWWATLLLAVWAKLQGIPTVFQSVLLYEDTPGGVRKEKLGRFKVWCLKQYTAILTISDFLSEDYRNTGFPQERVFTLMNPVNSQVFHPVQSDEEMGLLRVKQNVPQKATVLIFTGSIIRRKGVDTLIHAFQKAAKSAPDLYLMLIGAENTRDNPSLDMDFVAQMKSMVQEFGLADKVSFRGLVKDRPQLAELYQAADIFVFPSRNEGMPNVVLEAMACGLPLIVSRLPVLESVIRDGENGIFVPVDDVDTLAGIIVQLTADPARCQSLGQAANRYTITHHGFADWQDHIVEMYRNLMREG